MSIPFGMLLFFFFSVQDCFLLFNFTSGHPGFIFIDMKKDIRNTLISLAGAATALTTLNSCETGKQNESSPNIIYIMADDMGYADLGCYGNQMNKTPNIDELAEDGMRFTQHYAGSTVCAPSRAVLMTGKHTGHAAIKGNFAMQTEGNLPIPDTAVTVAEKLKEAGYQTGVIGKWGIGGPGSVGGPNNQGFDYSYCYLDQRNAHEYYPPYLWENEQKVMLDNQQGNNEYSHDLFTEKAIDFINKQSSNQPFFLYLPYTVPHGKYQVPDNAPFSDKNWTQTQKNRAAMITRMDRDIGKIMDLLQSKGMDENTIVFFTSDNGPVSGLSDFFDSNGQFRGHKGDLYEGGIRAPLIARWPGKIEAGTVSNHISAFWDFLPTACDLAGVEPPASTNGISFLPELLGNQQPKHDYLYWEFFKYHFGWEPGDEGPRNTFQQQAVRMDKWKGVRTGLGKNPDAPIQLYNLEKDIKEQNDVASEHPKIIEQMDEIMHKAHHDREHFEVEKF